MCAFIVGVLLISCSSPDEKDVPAIEPIFNEQESLQKEFLSYFSCAPYKEKDGCEKAGCVWDSVCLSKSISSCSDAKSAEACSAIGCTFVAKSGCVSYLFKCPNLNFPELNSGEESERQAASFNKLYEDFLTNPKDTKDLDNLRKYHIAIVPGLFSELYAAMYSALKKVSPVSDPKTLNSWADQDKFFRTHGLRYSFVPIKSQQSCATNAQIIADHIEAIAADVPIILMGHSKGGVDILNFLVRFPKLRTRIKGWISIQSPLQGTSLVDMAFIPRGSEIAELLLGMFKGTEEALSCMSEKNAKKLLTDEEMPKVASMPSVQYTSSISPNNVKSGLFMTSLYLCSVGDGENDGMVPLMSGCLPQAQCIKGSEIDHAGPVMDISPLPSLGQPARIALTRALLAQLVLSLKQ